MEVSYDLSYRWAERVHAFFCVLLIPDASGFVPDFMSMKKDSSVIENHVETLIAKEGPCGGAVKKNAGVVRRLRSTKDGRVRLTVTAANAEKPFDPTAWYVAEVKRYSELKCRDMLNAPGKFAFPVEAYAATQALLLRRIAATDELKTVKEKLIIHGKVFIRVAEKSHRVDLLKGCPYLKCFVKDASLNRTVNDFTDFARVPDLQIQQLRQLLSLADGPVEYCDVVPQLHDKVKIIGGQLSKGKLFKDVKGEVTMTSGRKYATVILDGIGCFKLRLPASHLAKYK